MPTPPNLASSPAALREATSRGVSDLSGVGEIIQQPAMSLEEQYAAVRNLKVAVGRPEERDAAIQLMSSLRSREDLFAGPARELDMAYQEAMERERSATRTSDFGITHSLLAGLLTQWERDARDSVNLGSR